MAPERQRWAAVVGGVLVTAGIVLHVVPQPRLTPPGAQGITTPQQPTPPPEEPLQPPSIAPTPVPPSPSAPDPAPHPPVNKEIPSLNARLTALRFFEGLLDTVPSPNETVYSQRFAQAITRYIHTELTLAHPKPGRRIALTIQAVYHRDNGEIVGRPELRTHLAADREGSQFWLGHGYFLPDWEVGSYKVDVYINGQKVGSGSFEIYE